METLTINNTLSSAATTVAAAAPTSAAPAQTKPTQPSSIATTPLAPTTSKTAVVSYSSLPSTSSSSSPTPAAAMLKATPTTNQTGTGQRLPAGMGTAASPSPIRAQLATTAAPAASPLSSSTPASSSSPSLASAVPTIPTTTVVQPQPQIGAAAINAYRSPPFTTTLSTSALATSSSISSASSSSLTSSTIYQPAASLASPFAARPYSAVTSLAASSAALSTAPTTGSNGYSDLAQTQASQSSPTLNAHHPQPGPGSSAPGLPASAPSTPALTSEDIGTIKQLLEAIESERLRKKRLEWYLQEMISEKEELILAQKRKADHEPVATVATSAPKLQNVQHVLDGVDNYMFTKKRRLSFVAHSGSLGEALQPPPKKQSITLDDASIASFLSFQEDDLQSYISAPSVPPAGQQHAAAAAFSSCPSSSSSSAQSEITVPPLIINSTSLTPRRPSICFTPSGSLSLQSSTGSFSLSLPGGGVPMSGGKGSLSSYSFSVDPLVCGWAMGYPQAETTPSQPGGGTFLGQMDPRISFDWNLWTNDDQLKETLTEFFDF